MAATTTGCQNVAMGGAAMQSTVDTDFNTAVGWEAGNDVTTGVGNTFVGALAGDKTDDGNNCTAMGYGSLGANCGDGNVAIGYAALASVTGGTNVGIGYQAGQDSTALTSGSNNVLMGINVRTDASDAVNQIVLGHDFAGATDNSASFGKSGNFVYNVFTTDNSWTRSSDERLKRNIQDSTLGLSFINDLRPVTFNWKPSNEVPEELTNHYAEENNMDLDTVIHGLVAQEVKAALDKEEVDDFGGWKLENDGTQAVSREMFIMPLIKAVQELSATVETLQSEIELLKGE